MNILGRWMTCSSGYLSQITPIVRLEKFAEGQSWWGPHGHAAPGTGCRRVLGTCDSGDKVPMLSGAEETSSLGEHCRGERSNRFGWRWRLGVQCGQPVRYPDI